jgi:4-hydroxybenzoate polyprenyltransferase
MTNVPLTLDAPLPLRLRAWAAERFPLANTVLVLVIYVTALLTGRALAGTGDLWLSAADCAGFLGVWGFFLMLRVFDEHKDYVADVSNHPERVLQRGLVTLAHLKAVGAAAIGLQLVSVLVAGSGPVAVRWAITMAWSLLMLKEFFAGAWLERHFLLYAASHLLAMPLALLWIAQTGAGDRPLGASALSLAAAGGLLGAVLEIARKVRAPEDERSGVVTYTQVLGIRGSAAAIAACMVGFAVAVAALLGVLGAASPVALAALAVALAAALAAAGAFAIRPTPAAAARVGAIAGAAVLLALLSLLVALVAERGV